MRFSVLYTDPNIILISSFCTQTMSETNIHEISKKYNYPITNSQTFETLQDCMKSAALLNPFKHIGYVFRSHQKNTVFRVSIRSPQSIALSTKGFSNPGFGPFNLNADNIQKECLFQMLRCQPSILEQFLSCFPQWKGSFSPFLLVSYLYLFSKIWRSKFRKTTKI